MLMLFMFDYVVLIVFEEHLVLAVLGRGGGCLRQQLSSLEVFLLPP